ncbi:MAG: PQQ-binding-like beta-propeller repeat protein [bacterium]
MKRVCLAVFVVVAILPADVQSADWPQYLGPERNATSSETGLARAWPEDGPKVLWTVTLGQGYGAPAVVDGKVYILDRVENDQDMLRCFDLGSGEEKWNFAYDAPGRYSHPGSRSVPAVKGQRVYTCGSFGNLYCFDETTQKPLWSKHILKDFGGGDPPGWGIVQSPLLYEDVVIVAPMTSEVGVAALDEVTGKVRWTSPPLSGRPSYTSPSIVNIDGAYQIVMVSAGKDERSRGRSEGQASGDRAENPGAIAGFDPKNGKQLWSYSGWQCKIPIPNVVSAGDGRLLIAGGYNAGSAMIQVKKHDQGYAVEGLYKTMDFGTHAHPPVLYKDHFYGHYSTNERRDGMVCMSMDGQIRWKTENSPLFDKGGMLLADGLIFTVDGNEGCLYLIEPSTESFKVLSKAKLLEGREIWAPLALSDGKLLIRDQTQMKCVLVR